MEGQNPNNNPGIHETQPSALVNQIEKPAIFPTPAHPSPRFLSKNIVVIILAFILIAFVVSGAYALISPNSSSVSEVATDSSSPAPKIFLKDYEGDGFSFQYPNILKVETVGNQRNLLTSNRISAIKISPESGDESFYLKIFVEDKTSDASAKELVNSYVDLLRSNSRPNDPTDKAVIDKINRASKEYSNGNLSGFRTTLGFDYDLEMVIIVHGNKVYYFEYSGDQGNKITNEQEKTVSQILSSFKFK